MVILNHLFSAGRTPCVEYVVTSRSHESEDEAELRGLLHKSVDPADKREEELLNAFLGEYVVPRPGGGFQTDYEQTTRWAVVIWDVPQQG